MAKAWISKSGSHTVLKLTFEEHAALAALLARVGPITNLNIHEVTYPIYNELAAVGEMLQDQELLPDDFAEFANGQSPLVEG